VRTCTRRLTCPLLPNANFGFAILVPSKLLRKQGVVPHGCFFVRIPIPMESKRKAYSGRKQGNDKLDRAHPPPRRYIL
jgi:hypothetical protein